MEKNSAGKKYQLTINNPVEKGLTHEEIKRRLAELKSVTFWAMCDEVSETGTPHTHCFLYAGRPLRFTTLKRRFPESHIESARGTVEENLTYLTKAGKWAETEKNHTSVEGSYEEWGEMPQEKGQGFRSDLQIIEEMLDDGYTPSMILDTRFSYRKYEKMIRSAYMAKRYRETPRHRDLKIHWRVGESGSGKSYIYVRLCEEHGDDEVYLFSDYSGGGWDNYEAQKYVVMDELKGQIRFDTLLMLTDSYKAQIHARYANVYALWTDMYITSIFPPEELYKNMVEESLRGRDKQEQLFRRITDVTYCFVDSDGVHQEYTIPMSEYKDYKTLKQQAHNAFLPTWVKEAENAKQVDLSTLEDDDDDDLPF